MQSIPATEYNSYDSKHRKPNARVLVSRNYDSIPFDGKSLQSTETSERYPKHILHTDGRLCMVYSKYNSVTSKYDLYFKTTNITRTIWNTTVEIQQDVTYDYLNPSIVQLKSSNNLGIIVSRNGTDLFSCVVDPSGSIQTALADTTINGTSPTLTTVGTDYWLAYEASGIIYYRTSTDFITWSGATNVNTITGLANDHYNPYIYYDTSNKLWFVFERVSDAAANPVIKNVYTMLSDDNGSTWDAAVAQTSLVAGEGSALHPSIIDTNSYRYINFTLERQIQLLDYSAEAWDTFDKVYDSVNNRILFVCTNGIVIYNIDTSIMTKYDSGDYADIVNVKSIAYDETNKIIVLGSVANGVITYNENTTVWNTYSTTTTPAISKNYVLDLEIEDNKIYLACSDNGWYIYHNVIDVVADTVTVLSSVVTKHGTANYVTQVFLETNRVLFIMGLGWGYPNRASISYYNKTDYTHYFTETTIGSATYTPYQDTAVIDQKSLRWAYNTSTKILYIPSEDTTTSHDFGIALYNISDSGITFSKYWSNASGNAVGLLPNPAIVGHEYCCTLDIECNSANNRLYIFSGDEAYAPTFEKNVSVINLTTELAIEHYARTNSSSYVTHFASIDISLIKIITGYSTRCRYTPIADANKKLYFDYGNASNIAILFTESSDQRIYYRKTADDITWVAQAYLTNNSKDDYLNLGYSGGNLKAFWDRTNSGLSELRWDEDLSGELDISQYIESIEKLMTIENEANNCDLILSDESGLFNPLNSNSLYYDYLNENNIIRIEKGNNTSYTPYFYGLIGAGDADLIRGDGIFYKITVWDKSKNFYKNKVTTGFYENQTVTAIATDIAVNYMNLSVSEYSFPTITTVIPQVQFIDETPMDILKKIFQIDNYYADFNEEGVLGAKLINYDATTDFTYYEDGTDTIAANKAPAFNINAINFSWDDNQLVNTVTVIGQEEATGEEPFAEEFMGFLNGVAGWFSKKNQFDFYYSGDKQLKAINPRMVVQDSCGNQFFGGGESVDVEGGDFSVKKEKCIVNQNVSNLIAAIFVLIAAAQIWLVLTGVGVGNVWVYNGLALVVSLGYTFLGQIGSYYYEIYAQPIGEPIPDTIIGTASDADLIDKYGENELEIDNPLLSTLLMCNTLAQNELDKSTWFRYNVRLSICANLAVQTGDVISIYNPTFNVTHKIYVREITNSYSRGNPDMDEIVGALIT